MRRSIPHWIEMEPTSAFDGDEICWHKDGADVPMWWVGGAIALLGVVLLLVVLVMAPGGPPANEQPMPGGSGGSRVLPTPYGPPPR